jgi:histidinol-phosphate aminotransferase
MQTYWSEIAKKIKPYTPGEQPLDKKIIKLNTNENPYPPSPKVLAAIKRAVNEKLKLYPDPDCDELKEAIADRYGLRKGQIFPGNGSDELLAFAFAAFFNPGRKILFPDISYSFYPVYAELFNLDYELVSLDDEFRLPVKRLFTENGGIILANPNAPTGVYLPVSYVKQILEYNTDQVVILDEAYIAFGGESSINLLSDHPNLLIVQTLSKSHSLAGLRVGFALGSEELIAALNVIKNCVNNYTLDRLAIAGAVEAIKDELYVKRTAARIIETRERVSARLKQLGFCVVESKANFLFISHPYFKARNLFQELKTNGILVRYFDRARIDNYLRVSIGSDEEMDIFMQIIERIVSKND